MTALQALLIFLISFMVVAVLFKMPVSFALGASSLLVLAFGGYNLVTVPQFAFSGLDSFALLAIPFYIFAGVIMEYSGISKMLIDWIKSFVGRIRGATGVITICACMAFGVLTGSAMATISAIGKMMVPELEKEGYPKAYNSALLAATCFLGILIPPSVPGIMYALASGGKISEIWMSTVGPAFIFAVGYFVINYFRIGRHQVKPEKVNVAFSEKARQIGKSTFYAIPALLMPIIIYGAIYGGFFTPTEAAAVAAVYALVCGLFIYREINLKNLFSTIANACSTNGTTMVIIGCATAFTRILTLEQIPALVSNALIGISDNPIVILLLINLLLLFVGCFMDTTPAMMVLSPILLPVALEMGLSAVHFGIIMVVNLAIGFITPPLGINLFVAARVGNTSLEVVCKGIVRFILVMIVCLLLITYIPAISEVLPRMTGMLK